MRTKVYYALVLIFLSKMSSSQNITICDIINKTKQNYIDNSYIYNVRFKQFSSLKDDTIRRRGQLYFYKKDSEKPPLYRIVVNDSIIYFNNSNYYGANNTSGNWFSDYSLNVRDTTRLFHGNFNHMLFPEFLIRKKYFNEFIDSCSTKTVVLKQNHKYYIISYIDSTITNDSMGKSLIGKRKMYINTLEIDKSTFLIKKQFREYISELGGTVIIQKEFFEYEYTATPIKDIIATIENTKPLPNKPPVKKKKEDVYEPLKTFPEFTLKDLKDNSYTDTFIKSRFVLVDFWYKSCAPCILNLKELKKIDSIYNKKDITILAINVRDENLQSLNTYIKEFNIKYPILYQGKSLAEKFHFNEYPQTFIYDNKDKKIVFSDSGGSSKYSETLKAVLDKLIN